MKTSDDLLSALRPEITTALAQNPAEAFQNAVLRPILKFQHYRITALFARHLQSHKINLSGRSPQERHDYVEKAFRKDLTLRHQLIGLTLGLMTEAEYQTFLEDKELVRRLNTLLVQRIQSTLS